MVVLCVDVKRPSHIIVTVEQPGGENVYTHSHSVTYTHMHDLLEHVVYSSRHRVQVVTSECFQFLIPGSRQTQTDTSSTKGSSSNQ